MCIKPEALLSGLIGRIEREGYLMTAGDLDALVGAGVAPRAIEAQLARLDPSPAALHARALLAAR